MSHTAISSVPFTLYPREWHHLETCRSSPPLPPLYSKSCFYLINIFCLRFLVSVEQHLCSSKSEFSIANGALLLPPSPLLPIVSERIEKMLDVGSFWTSQALQAGSLTVSAPLHLLSPTFALCTQAWLSFSSSAILCPPFQDSNVPS